MRLAPALMATVFSLGLAVATRADDVAATQSILLSPSRETCQAFLRKNLVDAYESIGSRNPKWDDNARKVLALAVQRFVRPQIAPDIEWQIMTLGDQTYRAGCDDPAVLYYTLRAHETLGTTFKRGLIVRLNQKLANCKYGPFLKFSACGALADIVHNVDKSASSEAQTRRLLQGVYDNLPGTLAETDFSPAQTAHLCADFTQTGAAIDGDRKLMIDAITEIMDRVQPNSGVADLFQGRAYWSYSWDGPNVGSDDDAASPRAIRHKLAEKYLDLALTKDPHCADAAAAMVGVLVDEDGDPARLETYFQRAIAADPDCYWAYHFKLTFLNNGKPGADVAQLAFGRTCLATKRWDARIPFLYLRALQRTIEFQNNDLYQNAGSDAERTAALDNALAAKYAAEPQTWRDMQALYEGYLAHNPKAVTERINYAKAALVANLPKIAQDQLNHLDTDPDPVFKDLIAQPELRAAVKAALQKNSAENTSP